jgi:hypothetical protein
MRLFPCGGLCGRASPVDPRDLEAVLIPTLFSVKQLYRTAALLYYANAFDGVTYLSSEGSLATPSSTRVVVQPMLPTHKLLDNFLARSA